MKSMKIDTAKLLGFRLTDADRASAVRAKVGTAKEPEPVPKDPKF